MSVKGKCTWKQKLLYLLGIVLILVSVYVGIKYILQIIAPFVVAYLLALLLEKPVTWLSKKLGRRTTVASSILVILLAAILLAIVGLLMCSGISEVKMFIKNLDYNLIGVRQQIARTCFDMDCWFGFQDGNCLNFLCRCADEAERMFHSGGGAQMVERLAVHSVPVVSKVVLFFGAVIVCLMSVVFLSGMLEMIRQKCKESYFREEISIVTVSLKRLFQVYFKVQLLIFLLNSTLCIVGLFIIRNPYAVVVGVLIGVVDVLPIFGTGTILIPWAILLLIMKRIPSAIILALVYLLTYFVRQIMESKCIGDHMGLPPFAMFFAIFCGLVLFGVWGVILGPIAFCVAKALIDYLKTMIFRDTLNSV